MTLFVSIHLYKLSLLSVRYIFHAGVKVRQGGALRLQKEAKGHMNTQRRWLLYYSTLLSTLLYSTLSHFILNYLFSFLSLRQPYLHIHFGVFLSAALFVLLFFVFYQLFRFFCSQGASAPNSPRGSRNGTSQQCSPDCPGYVPCINNYQYHLYINHPCV